MPNHKQKKLCNWTPSVCHIVTHWITCLLVSLIPRVSLMEAPNTTTDATLVSNSTVYTFQTEWDQMWLKPGLSVHPSHESCHLEHLSMPKTCQSTIKASRRKQWQTWLRPGMRTFWSPDMHYNNDLWNLSCRQRQIEKLGLHQAHMRQQTHKSRPQHLPLMKTLCISNWCEPNEFITCWQPQASINAL